MQFNSFEAGAVKTPPKKPISPSVGYPSNGDLGKGIAPTQLGAFWVYQLSEEFTALLKDNGIEPSTDDLHQLSKFFKSYKKAMMEIKESAITIAGEAPKIAREIRSVNESFQKKTREIERNLETSGERLQRLDEKLDAVNLTLSDATYYSTKINSLKNDIQTAVNKSERLHEQNSALEEFLKENLSALKDKANKLEGFATTVESVQNDFNKRSKIIERSLQEATERLNSMDGKLNAASEIVSDANLYTQRLKGIKSELEFSVSKSEQLEKRNSSLEESIRNTFNELQTKSEKIEGVISNVDEVRNDLTAKVKFIEEGVKTSGRNCF